MITEEFKRAAAETDEILGYLPKEQVEKIPSEIRAFFSEVKKEDYVSKIDPYKLLEEQELLPKTEILLTVLYRNYWCSKEEKIELDRILIENDRKYEEELRKKYNPDNIFKKKDKDEEIKQVEETSLAVYDNRMWHQKTFEFISNIFKKIFNK